MVYDFEYVKSNIHMKDILARYGIDVDKSGNCPCPIHEGADNKTGFGIHDMGMKWTCRTRGCGTAGTNIDFVMKKDGLTHSQALIQIKEWFGLCDDKYTPVKMNKPKPTKVSSTFYTYNNKDGGEAYKIERINLSDGSKRFMPQMPDGSRSCPEKHRILYNLDKITNEPNDFVFLAEGEKTADAICECGYIGTTFGFGCKSWLDKYSDSLCGRGVILMPDFDEAGDAWLKKVSDGLAGKVDFLQVIKIPEQFVLDNPKFSGHDLADYLEVNGKEDTLEFITDQLMDGERIKDGIDRSSLNIVTDVCARVLREGKAGLLKPMMDLREIYGPSMKVEIMEGDAVMMVAPTGVGKTRLLHEYPYVFRDLNFCIFDLELSINTLALRYIAKENKISFEDAVKKTRSGYNLTAPIMDHVFLPKVPRLSVEKIDDEVSRIETVTGRRLNVIGIDYIAKMNRMGNATESIESHASLFKNYCADTGRIGIFTTQCRRDPSKGIPDYAMPSKEDAIHTSALEQSCQTALCFCMKGINERDIMQVKCDKYTHGEMPIEWSELAVDNLRMKPLGYSDKIDVEKFF